MESITSWLPIIVPIILGAIVFTLVPIAFRRVVATNMVHIVQSRRSTTSYGKDHEAGNVYYAWPSWLPFFGITVIKLPVSNFDLSLQDYEAYDKDRVPFMVDVTAFFRISDTSSAAQRVASVNELEDQLSLIVQGAVRKVLASDVIDKIMLERSEFGDSFTNEVAAQLLEWGVTSVKAMELMDIRDGDGSEVISNIMAKKTSGIEKDSRVEVAGNRRVAEIAEVEAKQAVDIREQEAEEAVGTRTAEKDQQVGVAQQTSRQTVLAQERTTAERVMEVQQVEKVRAAEITRDEKVVEADQEALTTVRVAEGDLAAKQREAEGVEALGNAEAAAAKAMQMATVDPQIVLAQEIGENEGYQQYLAMLAAIEAHVAVGTEQAAALQGADVKVIANAGGATEGAGKVMGMFSSSSGTQLASAVEAFAQTPMGKAVLASFNVSVDDTASDTQVVTQA